jgi:hypothetical protein
MNRGKGMNHLTKDIDVTQLEVTELGLFAFEGSPAIVYLKESGKRANTLRKNVNQSAKFHVVSCPTIGDPRSSKRSQRYIATTRTDGFFAVLGTTQEGELEEVEVRLEVCRACLTKLDYKNYNSLDVEIQDQLATHFDLNELFNQYPIVATPTKVVETIIVQTPEIASIVPEVSSEVMTPAVATAEVKTVEVEKIEPPVAESLIIKPVVVETRSLASTQNAENTELVPQKASSEKQDAPLPQVEFTILTNIYLLQALLKRFTKLFF